MKVIENGALREMTVKEIKQHEEENKLTIDMQIMELKENLNNSDYKALRNTERAINKVVAALSKMGVDLTDKDYLANYNQREEWRQEINRLEEEVKD